MDQHALAGFLSGWFHHTPPIKGADRIRGSGKMNLNGTADGGRLGSWIECRRVPAWKNRLDDRFGLEEGPTVLTAAR